MAHSLRSSLSDSFIVMASSASILELIKVNPNYLLSSHADSQPGGVLSASALLVGLLQAPSAALVPRPPVSQLHLAADQGSESSRA